MVEFKRVTSQDVAERAGVSRTTVSLVLNMAKGVQIAEETRQRVLRAAEELGYVPDAAGQALVKRRSRTVGLVLTRAPHHIASDAFLSQILENLTNSMRDHGLRLILDIVEGVDDKDSYLNLVRSRGIDGILFSGPRFDDEALRALHEEGFPTVLMGQLPGTEFNWVDIDNRAAAKQAADYLISLGHRRVAFITNASPSYAAAAQRLQGYQDSLEQAGLDYQERWVRYGDFDLQSGYEQMSDLLDGSPQLHAVFIASDVVAFGALAAIRERGLRVPEDIAVVGFDDVPMARFVDPPLTTVHLPADELALHSNNMLMKLIDGETLKENQVLLDTHIVVRESSGTARSDVAPA